MGYRFRTARTVQSQTVRAASNSRLQPTVEDGKFTIKETRPATQDDRDARRRSARENMSDYALLPSSTRDLYLTGSHGLTTRYPTILLTTPRTANIVDVASGLTTTPFIINLNNEVKKTTENKVKEIITAYSDQQGLTYEQFNQNARIAAHYADNCVKASIEKDRIINLTSILNVDVTQNLRNEFTDTINGQPYKFLRELPSVEDFIKSFYETIKIESFTGGSRESRNTKAVVQLLKFLYNQLLIGSLVVESTNSNYAERSDDLIGDVDPYLNTAIKSIKSKFGRLDPPTSEWENSIESYISNTSILTDLVRIVQRDLIIQGESGRLRASLGTILLNASTAQSALGKIIGRYRDQNLLPLPYGSLLASGYANINDFVDDTADQPLSHPVFVNSSTSERFNYLDIVGGHDYLVYDDLIDNINTSSLDNLNRFAFNYALLAQRLTLFYKLIAKSDRIRNTVVKIMTSNFVTLINESQLYTDTFTSEAKAARMGALIAASDSPSIARYLFNLICLQERSNSNDTAEKDDLFRILQAYGSTECDGSLQVQGSISEGGEGWFTFDKSYLEGGIFRTFHKIAEELENALAVDTLDNDGVNKTEFGLAFTRDTRAFIFYQFFLKLLRRFYINLDIVPGLFVIDMRIKYKPEQFTSLVVALENYDKNTEEFNNFLNSETITHPWQDYSSGGFGLTIVPPEQEPIKNDAKTFHSTYIRPIIEKINRQEQNCIDLVNLITSHATQMQQSAASFTEYVNSIRRDIRNYDLVDKESLINAVQTEQAFLKKHLVERYSNFLRSANYLPAAIDHNTGQASNMSTVVQTSNIFEDQVSATLTKKFVVVVGLPTGLLESLRYENVMSTSEHLYNIDLVFRNIQRTEKFEENARLENEDLYVTKSYTFSSRVFVSEGSQFFNGPDTKTTSLTNYEQIKNATKFKVYDDQGDYVDATNSQLAEILNSTIVNNHIDSHYGKLLLKTVSGISTDEEIFDLVPQDRVYPDESNLSVYTTLADITEANTGFTAEDQLNKERVLRDLSRSAQLSPKQHMISMMSSKTFERVHAIMVDVSEILSNPIIGDNRSNRGISFISVVAKVSLAESQPPIRFDTTENTRTRSFANALGERGDSKVTPIEAGQYDLASQSAASVGINKMVEMNNKFGGRLGGYHR